MTLSNSPTQAPPSPTPAGKAETTRTIYVHPVTYVALDHGDELSREYGCAYSWSGLAEDAGSFERQPSLAARDAKLAEWVGVERAGLRVARGEHITRKHDMNPHGLV